MIPLYNLYNEIYFRQKSIFVQRVKIAKYGDENSNYLDSICLQKVVKKTK